MAKHPKAFISYSHDSPAHKEWVLKLATKLVDNGVDVILDQWDIGLGGDLTLYIEQGITESDRVLVICTDSYVGKANAGKDGVGYERMIVTAELFDNLETDKFIPIIRQASGKKKTPTFLRTRIYADFRDENQFDEEFEKLLRELYGEPEVQKPPLGKKPSFAQSSSGQEVTSSTGLNTQLPDIPDQVEPLIKHLQPSIFTSLVQWRQDELDGRLPEGKLTEVVDKAVKIISPLISAALMYGEANNKRDLKDQQSTLYDLLHIPEWNRAGNEFWADIPNALGYVYHSVHGSHYLNINQLDLALSIAQTEIPIVGGTKHFPVWDNTELMGCPKCLGGDCTESWKYLARAYKKWDWLSDIFTNDLEYRTSLVAYYMALHIHELAARIASGEPNSLNASAYSTSAFPFKVPLTFVAEGYDINNRAVDLLCRNPGTFTELWASLNVTREQMEYAWEDWINLYEDWFFSFYRSSFNTKTHLPKRFRDLFSH